MLQADDLIIIADAIHELLYKMFMEKTSGSENP